jgi:hypothetical protein
VAAGYQPQPTPQFPLFDPTIPPPQPQPPVAPTPAFPWSSILSLLTGATLPAAIGLVIWLVQLVRAQRQAAGKPLLLDQATLDKLLEILRQVAQITPKPPA